MSHSFIDHHNVWNSVHGSSSNNSIVQEVPGKEFLRFQITFNFDIIEIVGMSSILQTHIPESSPEEWNVIINNLLSEHV